MNGRPIYLGMTPKIIAPKHSTATLALAYFAGYSRGELHAFAAQREATTREVVETFARAVAKKKVARDAFRAFAAGWHAAEGMNA